MSQPVRPPSVDRRVLLNNSSRHRQSSLVEATRYLKAQEREWERETRKGYSTLQCTAQPCWGVLFWCWLARNEELQLQIHTVNDTLSAIKRSAFASYVSVAGEEEEDGNNSGQSIQEEYGQEADSHLEMQKWIKWAAIVSHSFDPLYSSLDPRLLRFILRVVIIFLFLLHHAKVSSSGTVSQQQGDGGLWTELCCKGMARAQRRWWWWS